MISIIITALGFLKNSLTPARLKLLFALLLFALIVGAAVFAWWRIDHLQLQLEAQTAEIGQLEVSIKEQASVLTTCSDNTKKLKADSDAWRAAAEAAQVKAEQKAQKNYASAKQILDSKPKAGQSDAEAANELLDSLIKAKGR